MNQRKCKIEWYKIPFIISSTINFPTGTQIDAQYSGKQRKIHKSQFSGNWHYI